MSKFLNRNQRITKYSLVALNASILILNAITGLYYLIPINMLGLYFALGI